MLIVAGAAYLEPSPGAVTVIVGRAFVVPSSADNEVNPKSFAPVPST
jgi:hypothetical protein